MYHCPSCGREMICVLTCGIPLCCGKEMLHKARPL
jgi:hypothetical protein